MYMQISVPIIANEMIVPYYLIHLKSLIHIKKPLDFMVSIIYLF